MAMKIGLFGIGLDTYWPQFEGLEARLKGYLQTVEEMLKTVGRGIVNEGDLLHDGDVVNAGLVDTTDKAFAAGKLFRSEDVELIFLYVTTYALSSTVLPVVQRAKVPVVVLNLSPGAAIDYVAFNAMSDRTKMTEEWLAYCSQCPVPEIMNVFNRVGIPCSAVTGMLEGDD
jgi:L-arabinose isomerase